MSKVTKQKKKKKKLLTKGKEKKNIIQAQNFFPKLEFMVCELATLQSLTQCLEHPEQLELIFFLQIYALSYEVVFWHCRPRESPVQKI